MSESVGGWMDGQMAGQIDGWMGKWMDGCAGGWTDRQRDGWIMHGRMDGWMDRQVDVYLATACDMFVSRHQGSMLCLLKWFIFMCYAGSTCCCFCLNMHYYYCRGQHYF